MPRASRLIAFSTIVLAAASLLHARAAGAGDAEEIARARGFAKESQYDQAVKALEPLLARDARNFAANELTGFCDMKLFRFDDACTSFERGDATDRYHDVNYGFCLRKTGRLPEAQKAFARAQFVLGPKDSWTTYCKTQLDDLAVIAGKKAILALAQPDDEIVALLNGKPVGRARAGGEVAIPLDAELKPGKNDLRLLLINTQGGWSYRARLYLSGKQAWAAGEGRASPGAGAFEDDRTIGVVADARLEINLDPEAGPTLVSARESVDFTDVLARMKSAQDLWDRKKRNDAIEALDEGAHRYPALECFVKRMAECYDEAAAGLPLTKEALPKREKLRAAAKEARERWLEVRKKVVALVPDEPAALVDLAGASAAAGYYGEAEKAYRRVIALDANRTDCFIGLCDALVRQHRGKEALPFADEAVSRAGDDPLAHFARGDALLDAGDVPGALAAFQRAMDCDPTHAEWIQGKVALAANRGGANSAAIDAAEAAVKEKPRDGAAHKQLADALLKGMRWEQAVEEYAHVLELAPDAAGVWPLAGFASELSGDLEKAGAAYAQADKDREKAPELAMLARRRAARLKYFASTAAPEIVLPGATPFGFAAAPDEPTKLKVEAALADLDKLRPALAVGLRALPPLRDGVISAEDARAILAIHKLAKEAKLEDTRVGLAILERQVDRRGGKRIAIDGSLADWAPAEHVAAGKRKEGGKVPPAADLVGLYAVIEKDTLAIAWRAAGPAQPGAECAYWAQIYQQRGDRPWVGIGLDGGDPLLLRVFPDGRREEHRGEESRVEWKSGEVVEARIPLSWLDGERRLRVEGYTWSASQRGRLDTIGSNSAAGGGESGVPIPVCDGYAPGLLALFNLAQDADLEPDDRVALAIAIDSADDYALGERRVQDAARDDDRRMLRLARNVRVWQRAQGLPQLIDQPLAQLLFWANRHVQWRPGDALGYRRDAVSPATLEAMFQFAQSHGWRASSTSEVVERCEKFLKEPLRWQYTSAEMVARGLRMDQGETVSFGDDDRKDLNKFVREAFVDGRKISTDGSFAPDVQFDYLLCADALVGHCGNLAQETVEFCRALGIPATIVQGLEEQNKLYPRPHAFAVYWDGGYKSWRSYQGKSYKGARPLTLYWFLPSSAVPPPQGARETAGGSWWIPVRTSYDAVGEALRDGEKLAWWGKWVAAVGGE